MKISSLDYIKWGFESRLKHKSASYFWSPHYIKWGFESRLKLILSHTCRLEYYIKWGFESRLKQLQQFQPLKIIISNGDLRVD